LGWRRDNRLGQRVSQRRFGIVGRHDEIENLIFATGFSGHGVMHAPATGRGVAELITTGAYETLDLSPLGFERIRTGSPLHETVVY
jgi:FAD-dependent oxidoreductase domain-containing protein 1